MINLNGVEGIIKNKRASYTDIEGVEAYTGDKLPLVYSELLKETNGFSLSGGKVIYGTDDIEERNETMEIDEYAKGYVAIGDDGEGNVLIMKKGYEDEKRVWIVGMGDMNPDNARKLTDNFKEWVEGGCNIEEREIEHTKYKVIMYDMPERGLQGLINIKKHLKLNITTSELLKVKKDLPVVLVEGYTFIEVQKIKEDLGEDGEVLTVEVI